MAAYSKRTLATYRHEYVLPAPAHWSEVEKAIDAARSERQDALNGGASASDVVVGSINDQEIVILWTQDNGVN